MIPIRSIFLLVFSLTLVACSQENKHKPVMETRTEIPADPTSKVVKTDDEWKKTLSP
jgi:hypothetical protein